MQPLSLAPRLQLTQVVYDDTGVKLATSDGATYGARRAIVTVPLGVLKAGDVAFSPPLLRAKAAAIKRLGMGVLDKVCY